MKKRLLSTLLALCMVLTLLPGTVWAAGETSGACGITANWSFDASSGTLTISGAGPMYDYDDVLLSDEAAPWLEPYSNDIVKIVISEGITHIGDWSFGQIAAAADMPKLTSVSIANTVTSIGDGAFYGNTPSEINLPSSVRQIGTDDSGVTSDGNAFESGLLQAIYVDENNPYYKSIDGVLYKKGSEPALIRYPSARSSAELILPQDIEVLNMATIPERELSVHVPSTVNTILNIAEAASKVYFYSDAPETFDFFPFEDPYRDSVLTIYYPSSASGWDQVIELYSSTNYRHLQENNLIRFETWTPGEYPATEKINGSVPDDSEPLLPPQDGYFKHKSHITKETEEYLYYYDESWFLNDSTVYNHDLATMSLCMAMAAYDTENPSNRAANIEDLLGQLKFTDKSIVYPTPGTDTIGYAIGSKTVSSGEDTFTLIAVAIRGGGYGQEWASNFTVGMASEHAGFANAADTVVSAVKSYIQDLGVSQNIKIWITGYSRAAATANIAAQRLNSNANSNSIRGLSKESIYAYCFECPQTVQTSSSSYSNYSSNNNIFNIANYIDLVTKVAPSKWDYSRYGITYYLPSAEQSSKFLSAYEKMLNEYTYILNLAGFQDSGDTAIKYGAYAKGQGAFFDETVDALASYFRSPSVYVTGLYQDVMRDVGRQIGLAGDQSGIFAFDTGASAFFEALIAGVPAFPVRHPIITAKLSANILNLAYAHEAELCLAWMNALNGKSDFVDSRTRQLKINCPVNIEVYDSNDILVAKIVDDTVIEIEDSTIAAYIDENDQKVIILPVDEEYTVQLVATGSGTVTYTATEYNIDTTDTDRVVSYYEVDVINGDKLIGKVENLDEVSKAAYPLYLNESKNSLDATIDQNGSGVIEYAITVTASGNGTAIGGGSYVGGEFAKVTATANSGEDFLGWYIDGQLISSELEYRFLVKENYEITARFTTNVNEGGTPSEGDSPSESDTPSGGGNSGGSSSSRGGVSSTSATTVNVSSTQNGSVSVSPKNAKTGDTVTITPKPNPGYVVDTVAVTGRDGESITVTLTGDVYTFVMPSAKPVTVNVTFKKSVSTTSNLFSDVISGAYYYDAVQWAIENGVTSGYADGTFRPDVTCTRAQIMTFLWRANGSPEPNTTSNSFTDVSTDAYYAKAVQWAMEQGITTGTTTTTFNPDGSCTRAQAMTFLWRSNGSPIVSSNSFSDVPSGKYYADAIAWAAANNVSTGYSDGTFAPDNSCTRAQIITFLYRNRAT